MTKRQSSGEPARRRGRVPRLRNARIRTKLGLILIVPITALVGVAAVQLVGTGRDMAQSRQAIRHAQLAQRAAALGADLQSERTLAASLLTAPGAEQGAATKAYNRQTAATDRRVDAYRTARDQLGSSGNVAGLLNRIDTQLDALDALRESIRKRELIPLSTAVFSYRSLIADLLAYRQTLANVAGSDEASNLARGISAIASHTEMTSQEQEVGIVILGDQVTPAQHEAFQATLEGQAEALRSFRDAVTADQVTSMERTIAGKGVGSDHGTPLPGAQRTLTTQQVQNDIVAAQRFEGDLSRAPAGRDATLSDDADTAQWAKTMDTRVALSRAVETRLDSRFRTLIQDQENSLLRRLVIEASAVILMVLIAIAIALLTARSMAGPLRRLRAGALTVAYKQLPQTVARLRDPETLGELTPADLAASVPDVAARPSHDEIGQVSEAFNVVHRETVRIAAEQASLRGSVSTMFTNLARRSQLIVDRLIGRLDEMEQGEQDPDRLGQLFQLDHLATQMRRNDENLLVLSGAEPSRVHRGPAPLGDILRAAQSQVAQYTRVELGVVDMGVDVLGSAVNDLVHLIAELLDNATSYSRSDATVTAEACWIGNRVYVTITDPGIGIPPDQLAELNARLADPPPLDASLSRKMGLVVVGRLAQRIGAAVELRSVVGRQTIAEVVIPAEILQRSVTTNSITGGRTAGAARRPSQGAGLPAGAVGTATVPPPHVPAAEPARQLPPTPPAPSGTSRSGWFQAVPPPADPPPARTGPEPLTATWETAADRGWRIASAVPPDSEVTAVGLPRREPLARLVPGSVEERPVETPRHRRSADGVRGMLTSFQQGLHRARSDERGDG